MTKPNNASSVSSCDMPTLWDTSSYSGGILLAFIERIPSSRYRIKVRRLLGWWISSTPISIPHFILRSVCVYGARSVIRDTMGDICAEARGSVMLCFRFRCLYCRWLVKRIPNSVWKRGCVNICICVSFEVKWFIECLLKKELLSFGINVKDTGESALICMRTSMCPIVYLLWKPES